MCKRKLETQILHLARKLPLTELNKGREPQILDMTFLGEFEFHAIHSILSIGYYKYINK